MLSCNNIYYRYARNAPWILEDFSHDFSPGIHLIKGFSGCGKSTFLKVIMGLLSTQEGDIFIDGILLNDFGLKNYFVIAARKSWPR